VTSHLRQIVAAVEPIRGWDFSRTRTERDPVPWDYPEVVRRFLHPTSRVLDIGTGGGEVFLSLTSHFGQGVGTDASPAMIETAGENLRASKGANASFEVMRAQELSFPEESFDVVLDRHAPVFVDQIVPRLRPGGLFICQQVGGRNFQSVFDVFGWGSHGEYWRRYWREHGLAAQDVGTLLESFTAAGCSLVARGEYDVRFRFLDLESLIFYLKALPFPEEFDVERHGQKVERLIAEHSTPRGIETNEHRELLIVARR
jgi:hypothetical protein